MTDPSFIPNSQHLLNILDSVGGGVCCIDGDGICTYCNNECVDLLGFVSASELLGSNVHQLIHPQCRDNPSREAEQCKIIDACKDGKRSHASDEVFWRKDNSRIDVECWAHPSIECGQVVGAILSFIDITERRAEEVRLRHLSRLVETSQDAIISRDRLGRIKSWNQGAKAIYGFTSSEAIGQSVSFLLPFGRKTEEIEIQNAVNQGTELSQFMVKRQRKNGEVCDISLTLSPLFDRHGEHVGCSSIERDISDSRRSQDAVHRAMTEAEHARALADQANNSKAEFLANVSHELRTPMNAILGMLNLSLMEKLDPTVFDYISTAKSSADSLLNLVNELLDFSKLESGNFEIFSEPFDLRETVDTSAKMFATQASEKGLELLCEIENKIPIKLIGDGRRIHQVLTNLIGNAVKFTDKGEIITTISIARLIPNEARLRFSVSDTGIGIAPSDQKKILLPFQQGDMSSTRQFHGTGLGLSICRELVAMMGGKLRLESQLGKGSTFFFELTLPVADKTTPADKLPNHLFEDVKVLILDDNHNNLEILQKTFSNWSMRPVVSDNAKDAKNLIEASKSSNDDISLAIIDSIETANDATRGTGTTLPIILMHAGTELVSDQKNQIDVPVVRTLTKPVSQSELLDAVMTILDQRSVPLSHHIENPGFPKSSEPVRPLSVLLVEDLPANRKVATTILRKRGHYVENAANGEIAFEKVQSHTVPYDVILMDVQMPVMDGFQATDAIRKLTDSQIAQTPIVAMTAHAMQGDREACLAAGMDSYIAKPIDAKRLVELVESIATKVDEKTPLTRKDREVKNSISMPLERARSTLHGQAEYEESLKRLGGDEELYRDFVEIFFQDAPKLLSGIVNGSKASDCRKIETSAHAFKGLVSNFGARELVSLAYSIEQNGRNGDLEAIAVEVPELTVLYERLCDELHQIRDERGFN